MKNIYVILIIFFLFRIFLIPVARHGDINNNTSWGRAILEVGPNNFYDNPPGGKWEYSAPNQPPLYIYTFAVTSFVNSSIMSGVYSLNNRISAFPSSVVWWWEQWGELYTAKLPAILADLGIAFVIYKFFEKDKKKALFLSTIWLVNPISWYNSSIWGGTDSIVNLLGVLSLYFLLSRKRLTIAILLFVLSLLFKGSLSLFAPVLIFIAIKQKYSLNIWLKSCFVALISVLLVCFPFYQNVSVLSYMFNLYTLRFFPGEIGSLTANAFNFWWIVDPGKTLDSVVYFGVQARMWGYLIVIPVYIWLLFCVRKTKDTSKLVLTISMIPLVTFLFLTRIHERYLYPFFPLATISLGFFRWLWVPYIVFSLINLLNLYHLFWAPGIPLVESWYMNPVFMTLLSIASIVAFVSLLISYRKSV